MEENSFPQLQCMALWCLDVLSALTVELLDVLSNCWTLSVGVTAAVVEAVAESAKAQFSAFDRSLSRHDKGIYIFQTGAVTGFSFSKVPKITVRALEHLTGGSKQDVLRTSEG